MDKVSGKLTVYFEEPFWIGIFERIEDGKLSVAKVTFGAECIFRKNCASVPEERSAIPLQTEQSSAG